MAETMVLSQAAQHHSYLRPIDFSKIRLPFRRLVCAFGDVGRFFSDCSDLFSLISSADTGDHTQQIEQCSIIFFNGIVSSGSVFFKRC